MNNSENNNKGPKPEIKNQMPHDGVRINLAMEIPNRPEKPSTPVNPPSDKK